MPDRVGDHARSFGCGETIYDPWHYVPVLARKPDALRNGAPPVGWELPPAMQRVRRRLKAADDGDRHIVAILSAVLGDGLDCQSARKVDPGSASNFDPLVERTG